MSAKKESSERTKIIPIIPSDNGTHTFRLHIESPIGPMESSKGSIDRAKKRIFKKKITLFGNKSGRSFNMGVKLWNTLEWIATSALIFMLLFFAVNYQAYYQLLVNKLDKIRGIVSVNPYIQKIVPETAPVITQELLPGTATPELNKKQIPLIALNIAPPDERVIIPRINKNVPVVGVSSENLIKRDWNALEKEIQAALKDGVVHYPGTAQPGQNGNVVITGHSSYFAWDPGLFKDVFALLHDVNIGDTVIMYYNQKKYVYKVFDKKVIMPDQVDVLTQGGDNRLTLITCTPVGTNLKRLVILARPE
jgi:LPXTG-site transpeptidase (sortase) family protein